MKMVQVKALRRFRRPDGGIQEEGDELEMTERYLIEHPRNVRMIARATLKPAPAAKPMHRKGDGA